MHVHPGFAALRARNNISLLRLGRRSFCGSRSGSDFDDSRPQLWGIRLSMKVQHALVARAVIANHQQHFMSNPRPTDPLEPVESGVFG